MSPGLREMRTYSMEKAMQRAREAGFVNALHVLSEC